MSTLIALVVGAVAGYWLRGNRELVAVKAKELKAKINSVVWGD